MRLRDNDIRITPSVLDRLIDFEPKSSVEAVKTRVQPLSDLKKSVLRDLEWLLNTRSFPQGIDPNLEEVKKSVILYGMPDITGMSANNTIEQRRLTDLLEEALQTFEPRFTDLRVTLEPVNTVDRMLKFRIEAKLDIEPTPEPVAFDTVLQFGSGEFEIKESSN